MYVKTGYGSMGRTMTRQVTGREPRAALDHLPPVISIGQASELLGISRRLAYQAAASGELPVLRLGRRLLVPTARLRELLGVAQTPSEGAVDR